VIRAPFWNRPGGGAVVAPSILSANFAALGADIVRVTSGDVSALHLDVMDGHFVPNITFGPPLVAAVRSASEVFLDCHLMIEEPLRYARAFADAGADLISIHAELFDDPRPAVREIAALGVGVGLVLNPDTPLDRVRGALPDLDLLLVMSVFPGFGGQSFRDEALPKIREATEIRAREGFRYAIEVDGGVGPDNAAEVAGAGADVLVAGSAVFGTDDPARAAATIAANARVALPS
jgi:ribulose-phosphate 3-epimerase